MADGSYPIHFRGQLEVDDVPTPDEQERLLGELDLERQLEQEREDAEAAEREDADSGEQHSRWWTGAFR